MIIRDRSQGNASPIHSFGTGHLATSDSKANAERSDTLSLHEDGQIPQAPRIPSEKPYSEVAITSDVEPCSAQTANQGGSAGEGHVAHGPVIAKLDSPEFAKVHGVQSNPSIMRAHQTGSITATDHKAAHGTEKCGPMSKPGSTQTGSITAPPVHHLDPTRRTSSVTPDDGIGVITEEPTSVVASAPESTGSTMPLGKAREVKQQPVKFTQADANRDANRELTAHAAAHPIRRPSDPVMLAKESPTRGGQDYQDIAVEASEQVNADRNARPKTAQPVFLPMNSPAIASPQTCSVLRNGGRPMTTR